MDITTFRRIVTSFADNAVDVDISKGKLVAQIRDELVDADITEREGTIWVSEGSSTLSAYAWIVERLGRLQLLADRLISQIPDEPNYIEPEGNLLDDIEAEPNAIQADIKSASDAIENGLSAGMAGLTRVLYLTSDAGEGKTTLIHHVTKGLARKYKKKSVPWLLVPISLGGRPFMALDDVVVAELTNRYRFNLYYDAFLELVKLNAIVPALDGFEEVFLETSSGEAVSALGNLINQLNGSGRVLVAARKAFFEVRSFASQAKMFDTIGEDAGASFERLALHRWSKEKFIEYARLRGLPDPEKVHDAVVDRLRDEQHPLVTRAVLVSRLIDVALEGDVEELLSSLSHDPEDYFYQFVGALVEREANTKWIDRSKRGAAASPLLTVSEHMALLTQIAREMWVNKSDSLRSDYIELIADVFGVENDKSASVAQQIKERLHQHSLLVSRGGSSSKLAFDHEDFRLFFLGQALGSGLRGESADSLSNFIRTAPLPLRTVDAAVSYVVREESDLVKIVERVVSIGRSSLHTSYEKENSGLLAVRLAENIKNQEVTLESLVLPAGSLEGRELSDIKFRDCRVQATSLRGFQSKDVTFIGCTFERLEIPFDWFSSGAHFEKCSCDCVFFEDQDTAYYSPEDIDRALKRIGLIKDTTQATEEAEPSSEEVDLHAKMAEQALRAFMRATHLNENVFKQRLGQNYTQFEESVLPELLSANILEEVEYKGSGTQRRFKLSTPMRNIEPAIRKSKNLDQFIKHLKKGNP